MAQGLPYVPHDIFARRPSHLPNVPCRIPLSRPWEMTKQLEHHHFLIDQCAHESRRYSAPIQLPVISSVISGELSARPPPLMAAEQASPTKTAEYSSAPDTPVVTHVSSTTSSTSARFPHSRPAAHNAHQVHAQATQPNHHGRQHSYDHGSAINGRHYTHQRYASTDYATSQRTSPTVLQGRTLSSVTPAYVAEQPKSAHHSPEYTPTAMPMPQAPQRPQWASPHQMQHPHPHQIQSQSQNQTQNPQRQHITSPSSQRSKSRHSAAVPAEQATVVHPSYASELSSHRAYVYALLPTADGGLQYQVTQ